MVRNIKILILKLNKEVATNGNIDLIPWKRTANKSSKLWFGISLPRMECHFPHNFSRYVLLSGSPWIFFLIFPLNVDFSLPSVILRIVRILKCVSLLSIFERYFWNKFTYKRAKGNVYTIQLLLIYQFKRTILLKDQA